MKKQILKKVKDYTFYSDPLKMCNAVRKILKDEDEAYSYFCDNGEYWGERYRSNKPYRIKLPC